MISFLIVLVLTAMIVPLGKATPLPLGLPASAPLPMNAVQNGGFESGSAGWSLDSSRGLDIVPSGCSGNGSAARLGAGPTDTDSYIWQQVRAPTVARTTLVLSFCARLDITPGRVGLATAEMFANWPGRYANDPQEFSIAEVDLRSELANFRALDSGYVPFAAPQDSMWHTYVVLADGAAGAARLFIDNALAATSVGVAGHDYAGERVYVLLGDPWFPAGPRPGVTFDDVYAGPQP